MSYGGNGGGVAVSPSVMALVAAGKAPIGNPDKNGVTFYAYNLEALHLSSNPLGFIPSL